MNDPKDRIIENLLTQLAAATELLRYYHDEIHLAELDEAVVEFLRSQPNHVAHSAGGKE